MVTGALVLTLGLGATVFIATSAFPWWLLLALWVVLGAGTSMINTPSARLLRRAATDTTRSYIFTAQFSLSHACFMITYPVAGWIGAGLGQPAAALVLVVLATLGTGFALKLWPAHPPEAMLETVRKGA